MDNRSEFIKDFCKTLDFLGCTGTKFKDIDPERPNEIKYETILPGKITSVTINGKL